jgi:hypothetical protein
MGSFGSLSTIRTESIAENPNLPPMPGNNGHNTNKMAPDTNPDTTIRGRLPTRVTADMPAKDPVYANMARVFALTGDRTSGKSPKGMAKNRAQAPMPVTDDAKTVEESGLGLFISATVTAHPQPEDVENGNHGNERRSLAYNMDRE